jgi:hypothetical protein
MARPWEIEDDRDDDRVVRDGESVRVPMYLMDGVQRAVSGRVAPRNLLVTDALGAPAGFRPGYAFAYAADVAGDPRPAAFARRERVLCDAWRLGDAVGKRALQAHINALHGAATDLSRAMDPDDGGDNGNGDDPGARADEVEERLERERGERDAAYDGLLARLKDAWKGDAGSAMAERDPEADRYLRVMTDPRATPQQKAAAQEDLRTYLIANFGERDGARRFAELTAGMRDAVADPRMAALADRQRQLEDAWRMR